MALADQIEKIGRALTAKDLAKLLSASEVTIFKQAATGRIPSFRVGSCVLDPRAVANWLKRSLGKAAEPTRSELPTSGDSIRGPRSVVGTNSTDEPIPSTRDRARSYNPSNLPNRLASHVLPSTHYSALTATLATNPCGSPIAPLLPPAIEVPT